MLAQLPEILDGQLEHVATVAKKRTGKRPSPATVWRWCRKGVKGGIKLTAVYASGYWQTTDAAFDEFLARQTNYALTPDPSPEVSDDDLKAAGLL